MNLLKLLLAVAFAAILTMGCSQQAEENKQSLPKQSVHNELPSQLKSKEIHVEMHMDLPSDASMFDSGLLTITNQGPGTFTFGTAFTLEKKEKGIWYEVPFVEDLAFVEIALQLEPGGSHQETIKKEQFPSILTQGEYRVVKHFYVDGKEMILAAPFTIPASLS